jgi:hypothetical protein
MAIHQLTEETNYEVLYDLDGVKSAVYVVLHNEHYKDGKFTITYKGDAIEALLADDFITRVQLAATQASEERNRALDSMKRTGVPENLVAID